MRIKKNDVVRVKRRYRPTHRELRGGIVGAVIDDYILVYFKDENGKHVGPIGYDATVLEIANN